MITYLTGGARSGKSSLAVGMAQRMAQRTAQTAGSPVTFVATGQAFDDEMRDRIALHQAERPSEWETVEAPIELAVAIDAIPGGRVVIVDCLSLWVSNHMFAEHSDAEIERAGVELAGVLRRRKSLSIVVTNEVGLGIVPENALARRYRDVLGRVNATIATSADDAWLCVSGRVLRLEAPPLD
jgi:adenosylcobinamide kinase / adenosylcobinamide-phosphate guanylyltransferase